jgi:[ribosomal protein S5]-alanine N-acetyltransferase
VPHNDRVAEPALRQAAPHRLDCGYALVRACWGRGPHWALNQPGIFRIGAVCDVENIGSARVMEKAGLFREGLLRRLLMHPNISDEPRDCFIYARTR